MNPGTFYLYEYENNKRRRNVGFIKVSRHYQSCILQVNARAIPLGNGTSAELYAFFRDADGVRLTGAQIATLTCFRRNIAARIPVAETRFPEGRSLMEIDGFLIRLPSERTSLFWMASTSFFDVNLNDLHLPGTKEPSPAPAIPDESESSALPGEVAAAETYPDQTLGTVPESPSPAGRETRQESPAPADEPVLETASAPPENPLFAPRSPEQDAPVSPAGSSAELPAIRKIRREDLSVLPRRFWSLSNNSFLLHGYHNYGHLVLIEENGKTWLGVPGIYDAREARAADLFGFPRFIRTAASSLDLSGEERSENSDFGHWCRCVGPCRLK